MEVVLTFRTFCSFVEFFTFLLIFCELFENTTFGPSKSSCFEAFSARFWPSTKPHNHPISALKTDDFQQHFKKFSKSAQICPKSKNAKSSKSKYKPPILCTYFSTPICLENRQVFVRPFTLIKRLFYVQRSTYCTVHRRL